MREVLKLSILTKVIIPGKKARFEQTLDAMYKQDGYKRLETHY